MALLTNDQINELSHFCFWSDKEIRSDLIFGFIASENDYTSNLTGALRRNINSYSRFGLKATSFVLKPNEEQGTGCDAAIVIRTGNSGKILLIEGKWPRLSQATHAWDWKQTASGMSHFSDQLSRQAGYANRYAIIEMFYSEHAFGMEPSYLQSDGSACFWHSDAIAYDQSRPSSPKVWSQSELIDMLKMGTCTLSHVVEQVCICVEGVQLPLPEQLRFNVQDFPLPSNVLVITGNESN